MVFSRGTEVNKDLATNNTMQNAYGILSFFTLFIRSMVLLIVYSEYTRGDNTLARYFTKW